MFGLIKQLFRGLLMFGLPALVTFGAWFVLDPVRCCLFGARRDDLNERN